MVSDSSPSPSLSGIGSSSSSSASSSLEASSNPVMLYSTTSSSVSITSPSSTSSSSSQTSATNPRASVLAGRERRSPPGTLPTLTGVLGGMCLRNTSGERAGPNDTLLRYAGFEELFDVSQLKLALAAVVVTDPVEYLWEVAGETGLARDSFSSLIDIREVDMDEQEERDCDDRLRDIVGVSERLGFLDGGVTVACKCGSTHTHTR